MRIGLMLRHLGRQPDGESPAAITAWPFGASERVSRFLSNQIRLRIRSKGA